jgi:hypothetical protein
VLRSVAVRFRHFAFGSRIRDAEGERMMGNRDQLAGFHETISEQLNARKERFQRWQKFTLDHFGYALNLILAFTVAALGYWFLLLKDKDFTPISTAKCMMILSLVALSFSAICGLFCIVNRLWDFRGTAQRARDDASPDAPTKPYLDGLGRRTWILLYSQLFAFALGVILLATALLLTYGGKLI